MTGVKKERSCAMSLWAVFPRPHRLQKEERWWRTPEFEKPPRFFNAFNNHQMKLMTKSSKLALPSLLLSPSHTFSLSQYSSNFPWFHLLFLSFYLSLCLPLSHSNFPCHILSSILPLPLPIYCRAPLAPCPSNLASSISLPFPQFSGFCLSHFVSLVHALSWYWQYKSSHICRSLQSYLEERYQFISQENSIIMVDVFLFFTIIIFPFRKSP